jgi:DNA-binding transcriptional LysR family regulator
MVDLKALETFVCVTDLKSFRRTACKLNTTQPAISQRIAQLERLLSTKLLHRDGKCVVPTPQGRELLDYARRILLLRDELVLAVGGASAVTGVLLLGSSETLVHTWLPDFIREVNATFPRLTLELEVDISPRLLERLSGFEIDLCFMVGPLSVPHIQTRPISRYPVAFVASQSLGLGKRRISVERLSEIPIVTFPRRTQPFLAVESIFRTRKPTTRLHASASLATATRMAIDGLAVAVIPPAIIRPQLESGELEILDVDAEIPDLQFVAAWHEAKTSPAISALVEKASRIAAAGRNP